MKQKELEELIADSENFIGERINLIFKKVSKDKNYKEKYEEYSNLCEDLSKIIDRSKIENLVGAIYDLNSVENNYIYLQGFIDGVLLRENFRK